MDDTPGTLDRWKESVEQAWKLTRGSADIAAVYYVACENSQGDWDTFFDSLSPEQQDLLLELESAILEIQNELLDLVDEQIEPFYSEERLFKNGARG